MRVIGLAGRRGGGKTRLMVDLVGELSGRGLAVSAILRTCTAEGIDRPGKDSFRHRAAGANEVMVTSAKRWALIHGHGDGRSDDAALSRMGPVDLVIAEDAGDHPGIEVYRVATADGPPHCAADSRIVAVASDGPLDGAPFDGVGVPVIDLANLPAIADFVVGHFGLTSR